MEHVNPRGLMKAADPRVEQLIGGGNWTCVGFAGDGHK